MERLSSSFSKMTTQRSRPIIAVCGATGTQGGSVVDHLLLSDVFRIRVLVRNTNTTTVQRLQSEGVDVVKADFEDLGSLLKAFTGVYGVYAMTNFFEAGEQRERQQGRNLINAAKTCAVKHFIWSTVEEDRGSKSDVDQYLKSTGIPRTTLYLPFYFHNVLLGIKKKPSATSGSTYVMNLPGFPVDDPVPMIDPLDIGGWVDAIFQNPKEWIGKDCKPCSDRLTPREYAKVFEEEAGAEITIVQYTTEQYMALKAMAGKLPPDVYARSNWFLEHIQYFCKTEKNACGYQLYPESSNWRTFLRKYLQQPPSVPIEIPMQVEVIVS